MKKIIPLLLTVFCFSFHMKSIAQEKFASYGDAISKEGALSKEQMLTKYATLKEGDTINVKFRTKINNVCAKKGCWMNVALTDKEQAFVKFKDYAFFMPLDSKGNEVIVNGKAFVSVESVDDLRHYAKDAGKSKEEINSITEAKKSYSFLADGVLIKE